MSTIYEFIANGRLVELQRIDSSLAGRKKTLITVFSSDQAAAIQDNLSYAVSLARREERAAEMRQLERLRMNRASIDRQIGDLEGRLTQEAEKGASLALGDTLKSEAREWPAA